MRSLDVPRRLRRLTPGDLHALRQRALTELDEAMVQAARAQVRVQRLDQLVASLDRRIDDDRATVERRQDIAIRASAGPAWTRSGGFIPSR